MERVEDSRDRNDKVLKILVDAMENREWNRY